MEQREKHLETLLVIGAGMTFMYFTTGRVELLYIGFGIAVLGLLIPIAAKYIHWGWMGIAKVLGFINSHIILAIVFFLFLTPLALIRRLGRKDLLQLRKKDSGSYFASVEHRYEAKDMEHPW
jgi:hypothetical protein